MTLLNIYDRTDFDEAEKEYFRCSLDAVTALRKKLRNKETRKRRPLSPNQKYLTPNQAADIAGLHRKTLLRYAADLNNGIAYKKLNGRYRINRASLLSFLERGEVEKKARPGRPRKIKIYRGDE
jgi:hypothetical protein